MLKDKEIGELWKEHFDGWCKCDAALPLIRKLVEDRKNNYKRFDRTPAESLNMALEAFNIDPATWTKD